MTQSKQDHTTQQMVQLNRAVREIDLAVYNSITSNMIFNHSLLTLSKAIQLYVTQDIQSLTGDVTSIKTDLKKIFEELEQLERPKQIEQVVNSVNNNPIGQRVSQSCPDNTVLSGCVVGGDNPLTCSLISTGNECSTLCSQTSPANIVLTIFCLH